MPNGIFYLSLLTGPFQMEKALLVIIFFIISICFEILIFNANSVYPDLTPRYSASDLGLHCLPMSLLWEASHKLPSIVSCKDNSQ